MKKLIIVGAGGFGREVYAWAQQHPDYGKIWTLGGFLDKNSAALDSFDGRSCVIGSVSEYEPAEDEVFVCAIGSPLIKRRLVEQFSKKGASFISLVHPSVIIGDAVEIGFGVVLCPGVILTSDIVVGDFSAINCLSSVGHDVRIGRFVTISGHCDLMGDTSYGEGAFVGSGARVIPGKNIGADAYVGAGSVILRSVREGSRVFGNPARSID